MTEKEIREKLIDILNSLSWDYTINANKDTTIREVIVDSLDEVEFEMKLEKTFSIYAKDVRDFINSDTTVEDIVKYVKERIN